MRAMIGYDFIGGIRGKLRCESQLLICGTEILVDLCPRSVAHLKNHLKLGAGVKPVTKWFGRVAFNLAIT